jgi:uncharacterized CHY-type Zn-finger protein
MYRVTYGSLPAHGNPATFALPEQMGHATVAAADDGGSFRIMSSRPKVRGLSLDPQTRCSHYHTPTDIIAIKMKCCGIYYACKDCHTLLAGHRIQVWPHSEWHEPAILCGACGTELSIHAYLHSDSRCPACHSPFNPACRNHHHFYFQLGAA